MTTKKKSRNERIIAARDLLGLSDRATLSEIKQAYRDKAHEHHPDIADPEREESIEMHLLNEAYHTLLDYCSSFSFPLEPDKKPPVDDEDWWMDRFGNDPIWKG